MEQVVGQMSWCDLDTPCGKMCQELLAATEAKILEPCWRSLSASNSQTLLYLDLREENGRKREQSLETAGAWHGEPSTLNIGECPSVAVESRLSWILEARALEKYYLSAKACQGILTRASRRGKALQEILRTALLDMIEWWDKQRTESGPTTPRG